MCFTNVCARQITVFAPLFNSQKKHILNYFVLETTAVIVVENREKGRRERVSILA